MDAIIESALEYIQGHSQRIGEAVSIQGQLWNGGQPAIHPLLLTSDAPFYRDQHGEAVFNNQPKTHKQCPTTIGATHLPLHIPVYNPKEVHYDSDKMLKTGLNAAVRAAAGGMQAVPSVRANMGCGIFPTLFGIKQDLFEDKMPWVQQRLGKADLKKMGPEDLAFSDEFKAGLEHMDYMAAALKGSACRVYPLDLQGPFDTAHLVYGDDIFYDLYDDPGFVHHLMALTCQAIFMGMDECLRHTPASEDGLFHYNNLYMPRSMGGIKISEDTSTLLSKEHIQEFVTPYTSMVLSRYSGGYIHYCGRNEHLYGEVMDMPLAFGINFGNPDMHDMAAVLKDCAARDKIYYGALPMKDGELLSDYFTRCASDAYTEGRIHLLLMYHDGGAGCDDISCIKEAWERACASTLE